MVAYRWMLRKGSRKEICPQCGKRRFVPYVSAADGSTIATDERGSMIYGRCDREDNCGYHRYPNGERFPNVQPVERMADEPLRFHPVAVKVDTTTNLFAYACQLVGVGDALRAWQQYRIGNDCGRTIFWQIALDGSIRAGKSIPYLANGHRDKSDAMPAHWLHKMRRYDGLYTGKELQQCYFGEHLLNDRPSDPVMIVESEKTAALMSIITPKYIWLASGGSQGIKSDDKAKALQGRNVTLLPDHGQYWNWRGVAEQRGWAVLQFIERAPCFEGCDILDYIDTKILKINKL